MKSRLRWLWIFGTAMSLVLSSCDNGEEPKDQPSKKQTYEPKFRKDGEGHFMREQDTLAAFNIEYAKTAEQIQYGMMYRKSMTPDMGMLFFMGRLERQSFYMRNTYVSLDIIFLDDEARIVSIQKNAEILNDRSLPSEGPALYVLEIKGGVSDQLGLKKGDRLIWKDITKK